MINRYFYKSSFLDFCTSPIDTIFGRMSISDEMDTSSTQKYAWYEEIEIMQKVLKPWIDDRNGEIIFEYSIPRLGKRIDIVVLENIKIFL